LEWKSEVDLLIKAISLLLPLLQKGTVFTFDREFTFPKLMEFLEANGMYFVIRLKKTVNVDDKPIVSLSSGIYEGVKVHKIRANVYLKGHLKINGREDFYAYVSNLPKEKLSWELYRERMKIEEMFKDEKDILNLKYLSYVNKSEVLGRWLLVFLLALLNLYLISTVEIEDHRVKLSKKELEEDKISFVRYAMSLATDIYSMILKVSKAGSLVLMLDVSEK
ncbi:MAG: transposase, partial [bacterium]|nr:transposase [bacterium]